MTGRLLADRAWTAADARAPRRRFPCATGRLAWPGCARGASARWCATRTARRRCPGSAGPVPPARRLAVRSGSARPRPAIRGGATIMDSLVKPEDAPGSGSEHGGNDEIAEPLGESSRAGRERESLTHDKHHRSKNRRAPRPWHDEALASELRAMTCRLKNGSSIVSLLSSDSAAAAVA